MSVIIFIIGLFVGIFGFSQIIYPIFFTIPKIQKLKKEGKIRKKIPLYKIFIAPIIWSVIMILSIIYVAESFSFIQKYYYIALGITFIIILVQIPKKNKDLEEDFNNTWSDYIK